MAQAQRIHNPEGLISPSLSVKQLVVRESFGGVDKVVKNPQPIILVKLVGGLGNQMFQYAAALALGERWQYPVKVDIRFYDKDRAHQNQTVDHRSYKLGQWKRAPVIAGTKDIEPFKSRSASLQRQLHRFIPHYQPTHTIYRQPGFCYDPNLIKLRPPIYLRRGYFQSEKFFLPCAKKIRDIFQLKTPLSERSQPLWQAIKSAPWPVALHVRRGDYVRLQEVHPLCTRTYYEQAVNRINSLSGRKATYFVFSDDISEARSMLSFIPGATFVTASKDEPWVDMSLMTACRDAIIANSSFSWWGAWLNPHPDKHIIAPRLWFGETYRDQHELRDLIPAKWITI